MNKENIEPLENFLDDLRDIDGFPIAKDEDILELSDPPYYTACPNPYIKDFIEEHGKPYDPETDDYEKMPFVGDVSEGKNDPVYMSHSYHTKVPYKAIIKFIKHYTEEDDIVFDGFCGSGMTGIAARKTGRNVVMSDLSSIASFIASKYNNSVEPEVLNKKATKILKEVEDECGWLYRTNHTTSENRERLFNDNEMGIINYVIWSDVLICPYCNNEYIFWETSIDHIKRKVLKEFSCPHCSADITKKDSERAYRNYYDNILSKNIQLAKQVPVVINYSYKGKRYNKEPDNKDLQLIEEIEKRNIPYWYPTDELPDGYNTPQPKRSHGLSHSHHFYTKRNLWILSAIYSKISDTKLSNTLLYLFTAIRMLNSKNTKVQINKYFKGGQFFSYVTGTLYIASANIEGNTINSFSNRISTVIKLYELTNKYKGKSIVSTSSITEIPVKNNTIDYIFTDPPFGNNIMYSELNFLWESWLKVFTNNKKEAIVNNVQRKGLEEYTELMTNGFKEMYRILKPNRWITIVFHNSKASVWNSIQESITRAGFIIAQVSTMDKKQGSFKQVTSAGAVKNDLIISAYKPKKDFEDKFLKNAGEGMEVDFVQQQLEHLPIGANIERTEKMLYSKMLAHYVENGFKIKYNANNFYTLLHDNFDERDGYWFLEDQADEYTNWKSSLKLDELEDIKKGSQVLFVVDEKSALTWIYNFLDDPKDYGEIYTNYEQVATRTDDEIPELREMLDNNFVREDGKYRRPQSKQERAKIEKNRQSELNRAWKDLLDRAKNGKRKIKNVRKEALVHGFTKCYQEENYQDIITVADRLYASTLESSGEILDFVDIARMKLAD